MRRPTLLVPSLALLLGACQGSAMEEPQAGLSPRPTERGQGAMDKESGGPEIAPPPAHEPFMPVWARALRHIDVTPESAALSALTPAATAVSPHGKVVIGAAFRGPVDLDGVSLPDVARPGALLVQYS